MVFGFKLRRVHPQWTAVLIACWITVCVGCGPTKREKRSALEANLTQTQSELVEAEAALLELQESLKQYDDESDWPESDATLFTDRVEVVMTLRELETNLKERIAALDE